MNELITRPCCHVSTLFFRVNRQGEHAVHLPHLRRCPYWQPPTTPKAPGA